MHTEDRAVAAFQLIEAAIAEVDADLVLLKEIRERLEIRRGEVKSVAESRFDFNEVLQQ